MLDARRFPRPIPLRSLPVAAALLLPACGGPSDDLPPNAVLVSLDTVRADHVGAWGYPDGTTPWLDRFARGAAQFGGCIAQSASTLPSHLSMFQSRAASRTGAEFPMLAELLRAGGWATVAFTGGGNVAGQLGFARGFDVYEEEAGGLAWAVPRFRDWLDEEGPDPFFAFLHTYGAHIPYDPPAPYDELFDPGYRGPVVGGATRGLCRAIRRLDDATETPVEFGLPDRRHLVALYDGGLRWVDARFGDLLRLLEARDLLRRTVVVVMSDHGEEFWDHGSVLHSHTVYQELVHVPLVLRLPGDDTGAFLGIDTVRNLEIAPTLLDALDLAPAPSHQGESLLPRLRGEAGGNLLATSEMREWKSLVDYPWKLAVRGVERALALYDLEADPGETRDLAGEHPGRARALDEVLGRLVSRRSVRALSPETRSPELEERLRALGYLE